MAFANFVRTVKNKASQMYSNFFYEGKDVPSTPRKGRVFAGQEPLPPQQPPEQQFLHKAADAEFLFLFIIDAAFEKERRGNAASALVLFI